MQVITVIPIVRGLPKEELSYFSAKSVCLGDVVTAQIQSREIRGIVINAEDVRSAKAEVKSGSFALRKILNVEPGFISPTLINAAKKTAEYFAVPASQVLGAMLPKNVLAEASTSKLGAWSSELEKFEIQNSKFEIKCIEGSKTDRFEWIRKNILSKKKRVLYIAPSNHELSKAKKYFRDTEVICKSPEYGFVWLSFVDIIILDSASGAGYHDRSKAKIDFKKVYEFHAEENNQEIIFADSVLDLKYLNPISLSAWPKIKIAKKEKSALHKSWLISKDALSLAEKTLEDKSHIFFFAPRKGVASVTICGDCGEVVKCDKCKQSLSLAKKNGKQIFFCRKCAQASSADAKCVSCESWKLRPLGVTVESVADELEKLFPKTLVLRISSDVTKTKTQLKKIIKQFYNAQGAILVGTELAIPYLEENISYSVISSIDAFLSGTNLNATAKAARLIFEAAEIAGGKILIETVNPEQRFFQNISENNLNKYRECELNERKKYNYPPFSLIIKVAKENSWETYFVKKENWPDQKIIAKIRALPKGLTYIIDADRAV